MSELWTIERVKEELPDVQGKQGDQVYTLHVTGRRLKFANVYMGLINFEVAWETLVHCLNTGKPVNMG